MLVDDLTIEYNEEVQSMIGDRETPSEREYNALCDEFGDEVVALVHRCFYLRAWMNVHGEYPYRLEYIMLRSILAVEEEISLRQAKDSFDAREKQRAMERSMSSKTQSHQGHSGRFPNAEDVLMPTNKAGFAAASVGSGGTASTAKVRMVLEGGRKVREELVLTGKFFSEQLGRRVAGTAVNKTEQSVGHLIRSLFDLRVVIGTVGKALISGLAITAFFGTLFAIVTAVKTLFVDVAEFALKTVSQLKEMRLGLQALLATTGEFSLNIKKNFELAGRSARQLRSELIALDPRTLGGLKELQVATQALLATGAQGLVSSTNAAEELAGVASLLVNTVVLVTGRVNDQRQIFSEIKELMLGNVRAQNQVAQLIASQVGDLDAWLARARKNRNLFEEIKAVLGGINEAADEFLNTLTSVQASEEALTALITEAAYEKQVDTIIRRKRELLDYTEANMEAIARFKEELSGWAFIWQKVVILADELVTRIQVMHGEAPIVRDRLTAQLISYFERVKAIFTGELFKLPTDQGGAEGGLGLTKSMEVLDSIRSGVKGLNSDIKKLHREATRSAGDLMDKYSRGMFNLNNMVAESNKNILEPLKKA